MADIPFALAVGAGLLAAVNPCGFALLPAYLSLLVLGDGPGAQPARRSTAVTRALGATLALTLGFGAVFGVFGLAVQPVAGRVQEQLPWFTVVFGLLMAGAGGLLLAGRRLPLPLPTVRRAPSVTRSLPSMFLFGAAYAVASLGCTIAPFLAIVVSAFRAGSTVEGILLFVAYAAGMGLVVGAAALTVALTRSTAATRLRRLGAGAPRAGGALLLLCGAYVAYYGWYEIRVQRDPAHEDPVIDAAGTVQRGLADAVDTAGPWAFGGLVVVLAAGAWVLRLRARGRPTRSRASSSPSRPPTSGPA
ncbi:cytochrome c biogenesis CcdA family protein [Streptomyces indicus]|uniref:Cytochrome c biogenesis protein CcdA n=1 Tax=Streptomyces indicus TaxID=417292 RepID=A0A1G8URH9_9ACTN|nr:cytochrome c biogenesis protein CcdA [Streptomyces indicus]SDJ56401.1 Cytochrome c biogenesis protein CcdA [Streptomyces indicus]